jgi:hypothetical protein
VEIKESAKKILEAIRTELVATSTVHVSEIANILEARMGQEKASRAILSIINIQGLSILSVSEEHVKSASVLSQIINLGFNDTIAYLLMQENKINQIYSFDRDFDKVTEIDRVI